MHLKYKLLISSIFAFFSLTSISAQTIVNLGCQNSLDGVVDLDRKDWNNGSLSLHSEGSFLNFDLPSSTGDCMKITEVTFTISVNSWDNSGLAAGCSNDFYLNAYAADFLDVTPASVNTSFEALPPLFEPDLFDHEGSYTIFCTDLELPFDGQFGVDVIVRAFGNACVDPQMLVSTGQVTMDYDVCVEAVIDIAGSAEILASASATDLCLGEEVFFSENGLGNSNWEWEGPNFNSTDQNPSYILSDPSDFDDYNVTVTDGDGCTAEQTITIDQLPDPNVNATAVNLMVCPGQTIELLETEGSPSDIFEWSGPPSFSSSMQNPTIPFSTSLNLGIYTVTITDSSTGCTNEASVEILPANDLMVDVTALSMEVCPGQDIFLEENGGEGDTWNWTGPSFSSTDEDPIVVGGAPGLYEVTVTDSSTGCSNTGSINIIAGTPPNADADVVVANVCVGQPIELLGSGGDSYNWEGPNSFGSTDQNPTISISTVDDFGTYVVTVTDLSGCSATDEIEVFQLESPSACLSGNGNICNAGCDITNPFLTFSVNPTSSAVDIELQFSGTGIPNYTLFGVVDGEAVIMCADPDPSISDADYNGSDLILPTNGLSNGDVISIEIVSVVDSSNPDCAATLDPSCIATFEYEEAISPNFEYNGNIIQNGDVISCEDNFDPDLDDLVSGTWLLDNAIITLPFDLSTYPEGNVTLAFEPDDSECAAFVEVDFENEGCACMITDALVSGLTCNDNNTPSDDSDDFISFDLDPQITNGATSYTITPSSGTISPMGANYGATTNFVLQNGSAGAGDITITISDDGGDPSCVLVVPIPDPGACSGSCNITSASITTVECQENNTPTDGSDDIISYEIIVEGSNTSTGYTITSSFGTESGSYGVLESFSLPVGSAGAGDISITITDNDDPNCTFTSTIIDPGSCSEDCIIGAVQISAVLCDANGSDDDPSDDFLYFDFVTVTGENLGSGYSVSASAGNITPNTGNYNSMQSFELQMGSAGSGDITLVLTDLDNPGCEFQVVIQDIGTCSGSCNIITAIPTNIECNDVSTPNDPTDDIITFQLLTSGANIGSGYSITTPFNVLNGIYDVMEEFEIPGAAGGGDLTLTIVDNNDPACTLDVFIADPGACSDGCEIIEANISNVTCQDGGTDSDDTDDFISFSLEPEVMNGSSNYIISVSTGAVTPNIAVYGSQQNFELQTGSAGGGDVIVTIIDEENVDCTFDVTILDPGSCSGSCNITSAIIAQVICDDADTAADESDDFLIFDIEVLGSNTSSGYSITTGFGTETGEYGAVTSVTLPEGSAGGGDIDLLIVDNDDPNCTFEITLADLGACSEACEIIDLGESNISCQDNGTGTDDTDDFITFSLDPQVINGSLGYTVSVSNGTVVPNAADYGSSTNFTLDEGTAGAGDITVTVFDEDDQNCFFEIVILDPGSCSGSCNITDAVISQITCDSAMTDADPSDDFITFEIDVVGSNTSTGYTITSSFGDESGSYNTNETFSFPQGTAGNGDIVITIVDNDDPNCTFETIVTDPGPCSDGCDIVDIIVSNIVCDDNGTDEDDTDDFISFEIDIQGSNLIGDYTLEGSGIDASIQEAFGANTSFATLPGTAGQGTINITLTSLLDSDCTFSFDVADPGVCSIDCADPGNCDDGDCANGLEFWDDQLCECTSSGVPDCSTGTIIEMPCDDMDPCTENDVMFMEECTGVECMPCQGVVIDCESEGSTYEEPCNDNDPNTIDDIEVRLICDDSVCIPCAGELQVPSIFIPNVFTPNGDGEHDELEIFASGDVMVEEYSIYDRWGELLFTRENILISDSSLSWDGRFEGQIVMPGVYVYYISLGEPFNEIKIGDFTVYR